jgi:hypothetical protein
MSSKVILESSSHHSDSTTGLRRSTNSDSSITEVSETDNNPGEMKADYRRGSEINVTAEEDLGEIKADYRRDVVAEAESSEDVGEMKADYRRDVQGDSEEDPGEMKADYRREV